MKYKSYMGFEVSEVKDGKDIPRSLSKNIKKALQVLKANGSVQVERDDSPEGYEAHALLRDIATSIGIECLGSDEEYVLTLIVNPKLIQLP